MVKMTIAFSPFFYDVITQNCIQVNVATVHGCKPSAYPICVIISCQCVYLFDFHNFDGNISQIQVHLMTKLCQIEPFYSQILQGHFLMLKYREFGTVLFDFRALLI